MSDSENPQTIQDDISYEEKRSRRFGERSGMTRAERWQQTLKSVEFRALVLLFVFLCVVAIAATLWVRSNTEDNPDHVGGTECDPQGLHSVMLTLLDGTQVQAYNMEPETYRMTEAYLLVYQKADQPSAIDYPLEAGEYEFAFRFNSIAESGKTVRVEWVNEAGQVAKSYQVAIEGDHWYARGERFALADGVYTVEVLTPPDMTWCYEIARSDLSVLREDIE